MKFAGCRRLFFVAAAVLLLSGCAAPLLPTGKFALPIEMGKIAAFLCSDCASQIIGAAIDCSGGTML